MKLYKNYEKLKQQNVTMSSLSFLAQTATLQQQQQQQQQQQELEMKSNNTNGNEMMEASTSLLSQHNVLSIANGNGCLMSLNDTKFNEDNSSGDIMKQHNSSVALNLLTNNLNPNKMLCKKQQYIMSK